MEFIEDKALDLQRDIVQVIIHNTAAVLAQTGLKYFIDKDGGRISVDVWDDNLYIGTAFINAHDTAHYKFDDFRNQLRALIRKAFPPPMLDDGQTIEGTCMRILPDTKNITNEAVLEDLED